MNAEAEIITSAVVTAGNETDGQQLIRLGEQDRGQEVLGRTHAGDQGYRAEAA